MGILLILLPALPIVAAIRCARGTTLVAPLAWALLAYVLAGIVSTHMTPVALGADWSKWMYIASVSTFCPSMALFGAKRPQNRAWQFIVLAFWLVMALPAIQSLLFQAGEVLEIHTIWKWFVAVLIVVGCTNYLPTRFGWAALTFGFGQIQLFWDHLPWTPRMRLMIGDAAGFDLLIMSIVVALLLQQVRQRQLSPFRGWSRLWFNFRDYFGVVWALRVMERANSLPAALEAGVRLNWDGFYEVQVAGHENCNTSDGDQASPANRESPQVDAFELRLASFEVVAPLDGGLRNILRRFVSNEWLDARLPTTKTTPDKL